MASIGLGLEEMFDHDDEVNEEEALQEEHQEDEAEAGSGEEAEESRKVTAPKTIRVVKNPQPKLDPERLCGSRGISLLPHLFDDVKFRGKNHEKEDLDILMKKMEHWAHRLFPKLPFDDCVDRIEKLGSKKAVQVNVKKIRLGMNTLHEDFIKDAENEEEVDNVQRYDQEDSFDNLLKDHQASVLSQNQNKATLTEEQRNRIEENKRLAAEKRLARLQSSQTQNNSQPDQESNTTLNISESSEQNLEVTEQIHTEDEILDLISSDT